MDDNPTSIESSPEETTSLGQRGPRFRKYLAYAFGGWIISLFLAGYLSTFVGLFIKTSVWVFPALGLLFISFFVLRTARKAQGSKSWGTSLELAIVAYLTIPFGAVFLITVLCGGFR